MQRRVSFLSYTFILFIISFVCSNIYAQDLSDGSGSGQSILSPEEQSVVEVTVDPNACPKPLQDWVKDDYTDKSSLIYFKFPSQAGTCTADINSYQNYVQKSGKKTPLADAESFSNYLGDRFKQIAPSAKDSLNRCNSLPNGQDKVAKTRYYIAAQKLESYSTSVVDELAYIDSIVPGQTGLSKIECNPQFPFPQLAKRCADYKSIAAGNTCKKTPEIRMKELVAQSYSSLFKIRELDAAYKQCINKIDPKKCEDIQIVIKRLDAASPWLNSGEFQQIRQTMRNSSGWYKNLNEKDFQNRITLYFNRTRETLSKQYESNVNHVRCLTYSTTDAKSKCDFEETRDLISAIPDIPDLSDKSQAQNKEFANHLEAEKCLIEKSIDREKTKKLIEDSALGIGVTVATAGLGSVASGGLKIIQGMSGVNRMRAAAGAATTASGANLSLGVKQAIESCKKESEALIKISGTSEAMQDNVCPDYSSKIQVLKDAESSCMTDALLSSLDVWPFVKGLKLMSGASRDALLALYKDPKQREAVEAILRKNGNLKDDAERTDAAEKILGRKLSEKEKNCVLQSHKVADGKFMKTSENEALRLPLLEHDDLVEKKNVLHRCRFDVAEISLLMRSGITGTSSIKGPAVKTGAQVFEEILVNARRDRSPSSIYGQVGDLRMTAGKSDEAVELYKEGYARQKASGRISGIDPFKDNRSAAQAIDAMHVGEREEFAKYAAAKLASSTPGSTEAKEAQRWLELTDTARYKRLEDPDTYGLSRRYSNYSEALEGSASAQRRNELAALKSLLNSSSKAVRDMAAARLEIFYKIYPSLRGR